MNGGIYTLLVELDRPVTLEVGALGRHALPAGWYAYTGSALGSGGFSRVERHRDLAAGDGDTRHWHVDYLLCHGAMRLADDVRTPVDAECEVARALPEGPVEGFGASDCDCRSHLAYAPDRAALEAAVTDAHRRAEEVT
ncbi:GIY-YIG nuclease family protein [Halorarius halobius]|uniref:GIY-YIG nuclease family protein n=1 Tax=Halorarius halobius TaxID=2962671 RepID=UPI0020CBEAAF|nr:GIY-YIG nuclease family protein [Halorarius halobius]